MRKLKINCIDFEMTFELSSYETPADLDTETGAVIFVEDYSVHPLKKLFLYTENLEAVEAARKAITGLSDTNHQHVLDSAQVEWDDTKAGFT